MPRTKPLVADQKIDYQRQVLTEHCDLLLYRHKISKAQVASYLGITRQALNSQFATGRVTLPTFMAIVSLTDAEPMEVKQMLKVGGL